jgi:hypothetical protein
VNVAPRPPHPVAALVLGAAVASAVGCQAAGPKLDLTHHQPVAVVVAYDEAEGKIASVSPDPVPVWEQYQYPVWYLIGAPDGSTIRAAFKKEDPLEPEEKEAAAASPKKERAGRCETPTFRRGVPKKGTAGRSFDYGLVVTLPDGTKKSLDPRMQIWP